MAFHDVQFPQEISYGSKGGPKFMTSIVTLASGKERRNVDWTKARAEYDVAHGIKDSAQMTELREFFYARFGRAHSFRFKDWGDFELLAEPQGIGDGVTAIFQMRKQYSSGSSSYVRKITKPVRGSLQGLTVNNVLKLEGVDWDCDYSTGLITFRAGKIPPLNATIEILSGEFDVHCRFDTDHFDPSHDFWETESWDTIPLVEIKD